MQDKLVSVVLHGNNAIKTIDFKTGAIKRFRQVGGKIIQGPIISNNRVFVTIQNNNTQEVKIYTLPNLNLQRVVKSS